MSLMLINSVDGARHYFRNLDLLLVGYDQKCFIFSWIEGGNRTDHNLDNHAATSKILDVIF